MTKMDLKELLANFANLDDNDVMGAIKVWQENSDKILSDLSSRLVNRNLLKIKIAEEPFSKELVEKERQLASEKWAAP